MLLLNTTGELKYLYERASVIFMGKSLVGHGGQNIIEPAACEKPVIFGPNMQNFSSIAADFLEAEAAIQIHHETELEEKTKFFLENPDSQVAFGKKATELVQRKQGGMEQTVAAIKRVISET